MPEGGYSQAATEAGLGRGPYESTLSQVGWSSKMQWTFAGRRLQWALRQQGPGGSSWTRLSWATNGLHLATRWGTQQLGTGMQPGVLPLASAQPASRLLVLKAKVYTASEKRSKQTTSLKTQANFPTLAPLQFYCYSGS